ncbi:enhanced serine sensitivity protein SseB [Pantoea eucrina]|uniref:Enhanced serine sensitivity protein SseB n=1 Tax=Pantoea eucrina TaxID=472693 RepID=A0ABU5LCJ4_9GAMM|nr:enhanced serine sensitivity protein SseB [Pantoea eucrina]MDZ7277669.1 enhanced serine sensitivity protein SseB [Pantoea eucrina]
MSNRLEEVLKLAATEPAHRPEFFQLLLEADVWVPGVSENAQFDANSPVELQHWEKEGGGSVIPFFTSEEAMGEAIQETQPWLRLPARTLFEMTLGKSLFLNPKLPVGKEFSPGEIAHLIGEEGSALSQQTVLEGGHALLLSEVAAPPAQMVDSLTQLFAKYKQVRRAWIASLREGADQPANFLIGIEAESHIDEIIQAAGSVATDTLTDDAPIDICEVVAEEKGVSHFFIAHITPFYERRWGSFLRDFKGSQRII